MFILAYGKMYGLKMKSYNGYIRWFDNLKGEGFVKVPELDRDIKVHWSADKSLKKLKDKSLANRPRNLFVEYNSMEQVRVKIIFDSHYEQVCEIERHDWIKYEDLVSDILLRYLEDDKETVRNRYFDDFVLDNIIRLTERNAKI